MIFVRVSVLTDTSKNFNGPYNFAQNCLKKGKKLKNLSKKSKIYLLYFAFCAMGGERRKEG